MKIVVASRRKKTETLRKEYPGYEILDLTSRGVEPYVKFSPFYPHGNIPVPYSSWKSESVEGLWQALKVFESTGIDLSKIQITNMKGIKRTVRRYGKVIGHQKGSDASVLLDYRSAREKIYLPSYLWVLENHLQAEISQIVEKAKYGLVLLDYETNGDIDDLTKPLSHAQLVKQYVLENHKYSGDS